MHPLYKKADALTHEVIGAAIEVHRDKGLGLIINFNEMVLKNGIFRMILPEANR